MYRNTKHLLRTALIVLTLGAASTAIASEGGGGSAGGMDNDPGNARLTVHQMKAMNDRARGIRSKKRSKRKLRRRALAKPKKTRTKTRRVVKSKPIKPSAKPVAKPGPEKTAKSTPEETKKSLEKKIAATSDEIQKVAEEVVKKDKALRTDLEKKYLDIEKRRRKLRLKAGDDSEREGSCCGAGKTRRHEISQKLFEDELKLDEEWQDHYWKKVREALEEKRNKKLGDRFKKLFGELKKFNKRLGELDKPKPTRKAEVEKPIVSP